MSARKGRRLLFSLRTHRRWALLPRFAIPRGRAFWHSLPSLKPPIRGASLFRVTLAQTLFSKSPLWLLVGNDLLVRSMSRLACISLVRRSLKFLARSFGSSSRMDQRGG